ncbi:MAG: hypothetical protein KJ017_11910 [Alphaproteobacteria bacterium]|nr:hypothetical protein [Alphaproteobacteria bacterium]
MFSSLRGGRKADEAIHLCGFMDCFTRWRGFAMTAAPTAVIPAQAESSQESQRREDAKLVFTAQVKAFRHPEAKPKDLCPVLCFRSFATLRMTRGARG